MASTAVEWSRNQTSAIFPLHLNRLECVDNVLRHAKQTELMKLTPKIELRIPFLLKLLRAGGSANILDFETEINRNRLDISETYL
jgi:hypothetical protein